VLVATLHKTEIQYEGLFVWSRLGVPIDLSGVAVLSIGAFEHSEVLVAVVDIDFEAPLVTLAGCNTPVKCLYLACTAPTPLELIFAAKELASQSPQVLEFCMVHTLACFSQPLPCKTGIEEKACLQQLAVALALMEVSGWKASVGLGCVVGLTLGRRRALLQLVGIEGDLALV
jgi:hypothetical protein